MPIVYCGRECIYNNWGNGCSKDEIWLDNDSICLECDEPEDESLKESSACDGDCDECLFYKECIIDKD